MRRFTSQRERESKMRFNVAKVHGVGGEGCRGWEQDPHGPNPEDNFIENRTMGERVGLRVEKGTFVDVEFKDGAAGTITLDSGAGQRVASGRAWRRIDAAKGRTAEEWQRDLEPGR